MHDIAQRHTGRLLTHKALSLKFCNITMEHVISFIDLCLTGAMKKGRAKKGVVVKPLVSSSMGSRAQVNHTVWIEKTKNIFIQANFCYLRWSNNIFSLIKQKNQYLSKKIQLFSKKNDFLK